MGMQGRPMMGLALLALLALEPTATPQLTAIKCVGRLERDDGRLKRKHTDPAARRIYVIDEGLGRVRFWNSIYGRLVDPCDGKTPECNFDFDPHVIMLNRASANGDGWWISEQMIVDRKEGTLWWMMSGEDGITTYKGHCEPTSMPTADLIKNRF